MSIFISRAPYSNTKDTYVQHNWQKQWKNQNLSSDERAASLLTKCCLPVHTITTAVTITLTLCVLWFADISLEIMLLLSHMIHLAFFPNSYSVCRSLPPKLTVLLFIPCVALCFIHFLFVRLTFAHLVLLLLYHYRVYGCYCFPSRCRFVTIFVVFQLVSCLTKERARAYRFSCRARDITGKTCSLLSHKFLWHTPYASVIFHKLHNICRWKIAWWRLFHFLFFNFRFSRVLRPAPLSPPKPFFENDSEISL